MADNEVSTSNPVFEILEEWNHHLKEIGFEVDHEAVDNSAAPQIEEPQP